MEAAVPDAVGSPEAAVGIRVEGGGERQAGRGGRDLSKPFLGIIHAAAYILLALAGWEIEPRASRHAGSDLTSPLTD